MKKIISLSIIFLMLAGCAQTAVPQEAIIPEAIGKEAVHEHVQEPLRVVTTIFPQFDFVRQIAGDRVELTMLLSPGAESHSFEPTPRDMITINNADLFIYVGGHSDTWVHPILESLDRLDMRTVALLDLVEALWEDGGHEHEHHHEHDHDYHHEHEHHHEYHHEHDHDHHHHHEHDHDHHHDHHHGEPQLDEHVWTSPINAALITTALAEVLAEMDPANADFFRANAAAYIQELEALNQAFSDMVSQGARRTIVFGDRFPFLYLAHAYNLTHYAAFTGCSSETQASPATVAFLIEKVRDENIPVVFYIEFSNQTIANVIAEATDARTLELHSAHNVSHADFTAGITYLELMYRNLEQLREALN